MGKIQATCAIIINKNNQLLLIKRRREPFANHWALISGIGFTKQGLPPAKAVLSEVKSDINSTFSGLEIFRIPVENDDYIYETVVFLGKIDEHEIKLNQADVSDFKWCSIDAINDLDKLAYEHNEIIDKYIKKIINT